MALWQMMAAVVRHQSAAHGPMRLDFVMDTTGILEYTPRIKSVLCPPPSE